MRNLLDLAERQGVRGLLALPAPVQRALVGRRVVRDGQTLSVETQLVLRLAELTHEPDLGDLSPEDGRVAMLRMTRLTAGVDELPIGEVRELQVAGAAGVLPARLYVPREADPGPLLVWFHGGGWAYGDLDTHDAACRFLAEHSGVRILSVDYRLAPEHPFPAAYDDALVAYQWAVEHADALGADPSRLAVGGDSAGGNLAALTAIKAAEEGWPLAFQLLVYPGTDLRGGTASRQIFRHGFVLTQAFIDASIERYLGDLSLAADPRVSPLLVEVPAGLAPAYVATAGFDPLRDEGEAYARRLAEAGVPVELKRFADQIHGFLHLVGVGRRGREVNAEIADRLAAGLRGDQSRR